MGSEGIPPGVWIALITGGLTFAGTLFGRWVERRKMSAETTQITVQSESVAVGTALSLVETLRAEMDQLRAEVQLLRDEVESLKSQLHTVQEVAEERADEITRLKFRIAEQQMIIEAQEVRIAHLERALRKEGIDPDEITP